MKNVGYYIRYAYKAALESIEYNESIIKVYDGFVTSTTPPDYYIEIKNILETPVLNDSRFMRDVSIDVEIITQQYKRQSNDLVDDITTAVLAVIIPTTESTALNFEPFAPQFFQVGYVNLVNSRYLYEVDEKGYYITRKILTFNQTLIEN